MDRVVKPNHVEGPMAAQKREKLFTPPHGGDAVISLSDE